MLDIITSIFGTYVPYEGEGIASLNVEYISGVVLFAIALISVFKIIGLIIKEL